MIRVLVSGVLTRAPEERQSKANRPYLMLTIREGSGDKARWLTAFVFADEAREAISGMAAGDAIALAGEIDAEVFNREGSPPRISWSVRVDAVLTAKSGARKRRAAQQPRETQKREWPNDPLPL